MQRRQLPSFATESIAPLKWATQALILPQANNLFALSFTSASPILTHCRMNHFTLLVSDQHS